MLLNQQEQMKVLPIYRDLSRKPVGF